MEAERAKCLHLELVCKVSYAENYKRVEKASPLWESEQPQLGNLTLSQLLEEERGTDQPWGS